LAAVVQPLLLLTQHLEVQVAHRHLYLDRFRHRVQVVALVEHLTIPQDFLEGQAVEALALLEAVAEHLEKVILGERVQMQPLAELLAVEENRQAARMVTHRVRRGPEGLERNG